LPEEPTSPKLRSRKKKSVEEPAVTQELKRWDAKIFEVGPRPGYVNCKNCFHYMGGGFLAVDGIPRLEAMGFAKVLAVVSEYEK